MARFQLTLSNARFIREVLKKDYGHLLGFKLIEAVTEGEPSLAVVLGPPNLRNRRGRRRIPNSIMITKRQGLVPHVKGDLLVAADLEVMPDGTLEFVRQVRENIGTRIIRTGLLADNRGQTQADMARLMNEGKRIRQHGVFPLSPDSAKIFGEGLDLEITAQARVVYDERLGRIKGAPGIAKFGETGIEAPLGGAVLVGDIDGTLAIEELREEGWKRYEVTGDAASEQLFLDYLAADAKRFAQEAEVSVPVAKPIRPPLDDKDG